MLELALAMQDSLQATIPDLIDEINPLIRPNITLTQPPGDVEFGIRTDMLDKEPSELPVVACGIYSRVPEDEGEQEFSIVMVDYIINIYIADIDVNNIFIRSHKWAILLDLWVERYGSTLLPGYLTAEAPDIDISYVLELPREGTFRQLITASGFYKIAE